PAAEGRTAVAIGIGVNCVAHPDMAAAYPPGSLRALGLAVEAEPLFASLARHMARILALWDRGAGFAAVRVAWLDRAFGLGGMVRAARPGQTIDGIFETIDGEGRLIVRDSDGRHHAVSAGDVFFGVPQETSHG